MDYTPSNPSEKEVWQNSGGSHKTQAVLDPLADCGIHLREHHTDLLGAHVYILFSRKNAGGGHP
jgi:hypothetical protein